jgi:hypothetical protein
MMKWEKNVDSFYGRGTGGGDRNPFQEFRQNFNISGPKEFCKHGNSIFASIDQKEEKR